MSRKARARALHAATALLDEGGLDGCSIEAVARRSGVAKTTIYRHWKTGGALLHEALGCSIQPFPTPNTGSLAEDLHTFMTGVLEVVHDGKKALMLSVLQAAIDDPEIASIQQLMMKERLQPLRTVIQLAQGRGEVHPDIDLDLGVLLVEGPLFLSTMAQGAPDPQQLDGLIDLAVAGLTGWRPE
ncbi:MAG: TetR/AcrR family transcriptional regulator [Actinomycetia bacterium]|nr:TetR/AcrR family transcriptional regulator [Actinomycetes bacterium]